MARHPAETVSVLTYRTGIQDANLAGNVHGGWIMKLCDDAAVIAATRLAGGRVVTAATTIRARENRGSHTEGRSPEDVISVSTESYGADKQLAPRPRHSTLAPRTP